ncbi:non-hydrolyzing UDP-N-acetylglucosamine 2-epimerase [Acidihalobacter ferrooxydans]|uniref:UDP-N-acetylglucosamine 2-epimerase (Non-hydrolyzing) n=1 Tax=Acidihalobacter ferrooxydans TaxID=1765967 RepID=A0A1P8UI66_9GAMM|nr:UDP-N-acetylglucosamine 2-epimerase (non-hydrolyzing) [Acidihalobacter ferrooxydans]APZ43522.1 UDP-N-acetylglucosamine 2-epimerase (non-hydrolyzing) [Acidihalobacter ferrooxydans]
MNRRFKIDLIVAARPNYMKIGPLYRVLRDADWCRPRLVDAGQHYDPELSSVFREAFGLPEPHAALGVGSGSHAEQTAGVLLAYEARCRCDPPDWIVVAGDVNATLSCALVGARLGISVAHLEAGLRSGDRRMPEEINRVLTDQLASLLWTPSEDADENLRREGIAPQRIECVGNIMIDAFELMRGRIEADGTRAARGLREGAYAVVTLHRPSNVDDPATLRRLVETLCAVADDLPLVFPVHPRTRQQLTVEKLYTRLVAHHGITLLEPLGYVAFMNLVLGARAVITDSGGVQEETTYLGIPCLTLRDSTERPITLIKGTNRLIDPAGLESAMRELARRDGQGAPPLWDGRTAPRVAASLRRHLVQIAE